MDETNTAAHPSRPPSENSADPLADAWNAARARSAADATSFAVGRKPFRPQHERIEDAIAGFLATLAQPQQLSEKSVAERRARYRLECEALKRASGIDALYAKATLQNLGAGWTEARRRKLDGYLELGGILSELADQPRLIAIGGERGTGKTHLACGLVNDFCDTRRPAIYATALAIFDALKDSFGRGGTAPEQVRRRYERPDLLVIDEVQLRDGDKSWQDNRLTELIDKRYRECKATVLLSNLKPDALHDNLGASVWRRLSEQGGVIEVDWMRILDVLGR